MLELWCLHLQKMPTIAIYKDGKKINEHVAQETGTGSFQKVSQSLLIKATTFLFFFAICNLQSMACKTCQQVFWRTLHDPSPMPHDRTQTSRMLLMPAELLLQVREIVQLALL